MDVRLKVEKMPTDSLVPYAGNAKEHPEWQVGQIAASIEQFGFCDPVGIWHDEDGSPVIVEGHGRVLAAKSLGIREVPVVTLDHLDDEGRRAYTLAHNQTTMTSGFDPEKLSAELSDLAIDMSAFGFDMNELVGLESCDGITEDVAPEPSDEGEPQVKVGELWRLGDHYLLCGDATNIDDVAKLLRGGVEVSLLLTDPPYNVDYEGCTKDRLTIANDRFENDADFRNFIADALTACKPHMKAGAAFYIWFAAWRTIELFQACGDAGLDVRQELYWIKQTFALGHQDYQWQTEPCLYGWKEGAAHWFAPTRCEHNVIDDAVDPSKMKKADLVQMVRDFLDNGVETDAIRADKPMRSAEHPTMKPVALFARLIRNSSRKGDCVLDVFGGSGTTLIACEQMGRKAYLMELDPRYCDVIIRRWEKLTGKQAELVSE